MQTFTEVLGNSKNGPKENVKHTAVNISSEEAAERLEIQIQSIFNLSGEKRCR
ncbi:MAG: hypothetical protein JW864_04805 [Spirochaetes bacterium]|nr:hypothetical protein [Spirochaetota bacterium]